MISELDLSNKSKLSASCIQVHQEIKNTIHIFALSAEQTTVESTHQIRKKLKFYRAFVKLLKSCSTDSEYSKVNMLLRDWGKQFSELRDSHVRRFDLSELQKKNATLYLNAVNDLEKLNNRIITEKEAELLHQSDKFSWLSHELDSSQIISDYFNNLKVEPEMIILALRESYIKSRDAFQAGVADKDQPDLMHEWRKRLKDLHNQLELTAGQLYDELFDSKKDIEQLCDTLGVINNYVMLLNWIHGVKKNIQHRSEIDVLCNELKKSCIVLQNEAERCGYKIYETDPELLKTILGKPEK